MENLRFVENGVLMGVPVGFKFDPTDDELIVHYLHKKVMSLPLPAYTIPEFEIYKSDTWDFPGDPEIRRYFFSLNEDSYPNGDIPNSSGYWKPIGIDRPIVVSDGKQVIMAMKKILVFYRGKSPNGFQTNWVIFQYRLPAYAAADGSVVNPNKNIKLFESSDINAAVAMDKYWVLSKLFWKNYERKKAVRPRLLSSPASSGSSGTAVEISSTNELDGEEEISSRKKP